MFLLPSVLDVDIPAGFSITITFSSSYNTGKGREIFDAFNSCWLTSTISPGLSEYEFNVTGLLFILITPLCNNFFILVRGESGYCSARNSIRVNDLFTVVLKWLLIN